MAKSEAEGKPYESKKPIVVKYGLYHVTYLIEIELVSSLPSNSFVTLYK